MAAYTTIDNPELYFQAKTYTGNGTAIGSGGQAITLDGSENMQPDLVWIKNRSATGNHIITDAVRGVQLMMMSDNTDAETNQTQGLTSFNSNGFTVGSLAEVNTSSNNFVSWNWKKVAGVFDIQTYTGNGSARTISHNLGAVPKMMIIKKRNTTAPWSVGHASLGANQVLELDANDAVATDATYWNNTRPTSSVFTVGTDGNQNTDGHTYVIYLFGNKQGASKMGSYTGNGNADGTFIYTGFLPSFVMVKRTSGTGSWWMRDNKIAPFNLASNVLQANDTGVQADGVGTMDFLSNGFRLRDTTDASNTSGGTYIYMAFAEQPFVTSTGVPATAR